MIIEETTEHVWALHACFTGVKLLNGCGGIPYTPAADMHRSCCFILNTKGQGALKGAAVYDILRLPPVSPLSATVRTAVLNALSSFFLSAGKYHKKRPGGTAR